MRRLRLAILLLVTAALLSAGCGDSYQVAVRVGDLELSHQDLEAEAASWGSSAELMSQLQIAAAPEGGTVPQQIVNEILNLHIQGELARLATADAAASPEGEEQMRQVRAQVEADFGPLFADFPDDQREQIFRDVTALQFQSLVGAAPVDADVYVSSRYGSTDFNNVVQSPIGALADPAAPAAGV